MLHIHFGLVCVMKHLLLCHWLLPSCKLVRGGGIGLCEPDIELFVIGALPGFFKLLLAIFATELSDPVPLRIASCPFESTGWVNPVSATANMLLSGIRQSFVMSDYRSRSKILRISLLMFSTSRNWLPLISTIVHLLTTIEDWPASTA